MNQLFYQMFPYQNDFSDKLFDNGLYGILGIIMLTTAILSAVTFYYIINSTRFNHKRHWFIVMAMVVVLNFLIAAIYPANYLAKAVDAQYGIDLTAVCGIVAAAWSALFFVVASLLMKWWSRNCSTTPF